MPRAKIDCDEKYPVYTLETEGYTWGRTVIVDQDLIDRFDTVYEQYMELQKILDQLHLRAELISECDNKLSALIEFGASEEEWELSRRGKGDSL